ncbi:MAG: rhamnogalacturonan acetylesterase [Erysipelotrichaceae bacterium]|nr:rhamnogalacturonan acetylesterase [Erysipelotrichaceae bacterium]
MADKLIFLGDSTLQYNDETTYPQVGWPQTVYDRFENIEIYNFAKNGKSTKTFMNLGYFDEALKVMDENSYVVIEFGHNDEHDYDPETYTQPYTEYKDNLKHMVSVCREKGAEVILLTSIYRRWFLEDGSIRMDCHKDYREAMIEAAEETGTDLIDMCVLTRDMLIELGDENSKDLYMYFPADTYPLYPEGMKDNTHLVYKGGLKIGNIFIEQLKKNNDQLSKYLKGV